MADQAVTPTPEMPAATPAATPTPSASPANASTATGPSASAAPEKAPAPTTLAEDAGGDKSTVAPTDWPSNWRDIMAGGDANALKTLSRFHSPVNLFKSWSAARQKMSTGELVRSRPENTEDEVAMNEWRASIGLPDKPEGYLDKVPDGLVFGDEDKPMLDDFLKSMHGKDAPPDYVHSALQWYQSIREKNLQARAEADKAHRIKAEDDLRSEWGPEYRGNINGIRAMFETMAPKGLLEKFFSARLSDGTPLGDDPDTLRFLVSLDRAVNPHGSIPTPESHAGKAMTSEMETIKKAMGDRNSDYWRGPKTPTGETQMQARYRELLETQEKQGRGRKAA